MKATMVTTHSKKPPEDTSVSVRWKGTCPQIVEAIQVSLPIPNVSQVHRYP